MSCGIIILAAGSSSRLGRPKQLLELEGKKLINHIVDVATMSDVQHVVVVLGASHEIISGEINQPAVHKVMNSDWAEGIASSIRSGLSAITKINPVIEAVILAVCDQPYISSAIINELVKKHEQTGKPIVACSYDNTVGTPVLFARSVFDELNALRGDVGARAVIKRHKGEVATVDFPKGSWDIDTQEAYETFLRVK